MKVNIPAAKSMGYSVFWEQGKAGFRRRSKEGVLLHESKAVYDDEDFAWLGACKHAGIPCKGPKVIQKRKDRMRIDIDGVATMKVMRDPDAIERNEPSRFYLQREQVAFGKKVGLTIEYRNLV